MHQAAQYGKMAELELVTEWAPERINEADSWGDTPLHCAARYDQEAVVSFQLSVGANVNQTNKYGETPLSLTCNGRVKQLLREAGGH